VFKNKLINQAFDEFGKRFIDLTSSK